jgi:hypothetical protein
MKLLGHESMATLQRYVVVAARETRAAASQNARYRILFVSACLAPERTTVATTCEGLRTKQTVTPRIRLRHLGRRAVSRGPHSLPAVATTRDTLPKSWTTVIIHNPSVDPSVDLPRIRNLGEASFRDAIDCGGRGQSGDAVSTGGRVAPALCSNMPDG